MKKKNLLQLTIYQYVNIVAWMLKSLLNLNLMPLAKPILLPLNFFFQILFWIQIELYEIK